MTAVVADTPRSSITLRDYQLDIIERIGEAEQRDVRRQLVVASTGLGKTIVISSLIERRGGRAVVLAHRDELISQAAAKIIEVDPSLTPTPSVLEALLAAGRRDLAVNACTDNRKVIGIVKAGANDVNADVVVGSVQTLSRDRRLQDLTFSETVMGQFDLVVVDEAHHTRADSYVKILDALGCGTDGGPLLLGVTATPDRGDGRGLDDLFDEIVASYDILWGIRSGYLSDIRGVSVKLAGFDAKALKVRGGDFIAGQSGQMLQDADAPAEVLAAWQEHAPTRKTLIFTPTVDLARQMADEFSAAGVQAAMVSGDTPLDERKDILQRLKNGTLQVLTNCNVLTEGFDEPSIDCIVVARPTKSRALYTQMIGRGSRRFPLKEDCLVIDVVGASNHHSLVTIPSLFGITKAAPMETGGELLTSALDKQEEARIAAGELKSSTVDLFKKMRGSGIAWTKATARDPRMTQYIRQLGPSSPIPDGHGGEIFASNATVVLVQRSLEEDEWSCAIMWEGSEDKKAKTQHRMLIDRVSLEIAQGVGEDFIRKNAPRVLVDSGAPWRKLPPSDNQISAAAKWKMPVDPAWTRGELSDALSEHIARKTGKRL